MMKNWKLFIVLLMISVACSSELEQEMESQVDAIETTATMESENSFCLTHEVNTSGIQKNAFTAKKWNNHNLNALSNCGNGEYEVRIKVWVIRDSNGNGGQSITDVNIALNTLSNDFAPYGITFNNLGISDIDNDLFYHPRIDGPAVPGSPFIYSMKASIADLVKLSPGALYRQDDRIDIFMLPALGHPDKGVGLARFVDMSNSAPPGNALGLGGIRDNVNIVPTSVISHEMGHCLGLYHVYETNAPPLGCPELVNGNANNRENCGDLVSDTPASPLFTPANVDVVNCEYNGNNVDIAGTPYVDVAFDNVMAVSIMDCLSNKFTTGQVTRMKQMMNTNSILAPIVTLPAPCCYDSNWKLIGLPPMVGGVRNVSNSQTVNYKVKEIGLQNDINENNPVIRVSAANFPANVVYNGQSYGISANSYVNIPIVGSNECDENPIINAPLTFYRLQVPGYQNLIVTVKLQSVTAGHTKNSTTHSFTML